MNKLAWNISHTSITRQRVRDSERERSNVPEVMIL